MARIIQLYKQALRLDGSHVMTLCNYGALLHEYLHDVKGDLVEVEKMYNKALSIDANHIDTLRSHKSHRQCDSLRSPTCSLDTVLAHTGGALICAETNPLSRP